MACYALVCAINFTCSHGRLVPRVGERRQAAQTPPLRTLRPLRTLPQPAGSPHPPVLALSYHGVPDALGADGNTSAQPDIATCLHQNAHALHAKANGSAACRCTADMSLRLHSEIHNRAATHAGCGGDPIPLQAAAQELALRLATAQVTTKCAWPKRVHGQTQTTCMCVGPAMRVTTAKPGLLDSWCHTHPTTPVAG